MPLSSGGGGGGSGGSGSGGPSAAPTCLDRLCCRGSCVGCLSQMDKSSVFFLQALSVWVCLCLPGNIVTFVLYHKADREGEMQVRSITARCYYPRHNGWPNSSSFFSL